MTYWTYFPIIRLLKSYLKALFKLAIPGLFFFIFVFSIQLKVDKICRWLDSNRGSLVLEATIRPPNQLSHNHYPYLNCFVKVRLTLQETGYLSRSVFSAINWPIPLKRMAREGLEIMKTLWKCLNVGLMRKTGHLFTYQVKNIKKIAIFGWTQ